MQRSIRLSTEKRINNLNICSLLFFTIWACCVLMPVYALASEQSDFYQLSVNLKAGEISVRAELRDIAKAEKLCLPAFGQRYGESLSHPRVLDTSGKPVAVKFDAAGCLNQLEASSLVFQYVVSMAALPQGRFWVASELSPYYDGSSLIFPGESLFIERDASASVNGVQGARVELIGGGQTVTTLKLSDQSGEYPIYSARDKFELTRSYWAMGTSRVVVASSGQMTWTLAVDPKWQTNVNVMERELTQILSYYGNLLPLKTPQRLSIFLFSLPFDAHYSHGFARHGGIVLQMGQSAASQGAARRVLMAHELFHLYNGEGLRFSPKDYAGTAWFREGMTQYIAFKSLLTLGLISHEQFQEWMTSSIVRTMSAKQHGQLHKADFAYHHGFFTSLAIEQQWALHHTGYNLENFWYFLSQHKAWNALQTNASIRELLTAYSAFDFQDFFKQYITGKRPLPIESLLKLSGYCFRPMTTWRYSIGVEYAYDALNARLYVKSLDPNGAGAQAGLKIGDWIVPESDMRWEDAADKKITVIRGNSTLQMRIPALGVMQKGISVENCR